MEKGTQRHVARRRVCANLLMHTQGEGQRHMPSSPDLIFCGTKHEEESVNLVTARRPFELASTSSMPLPIYTLLSTEQSNGCVDVLHCSACFGLIVSHKTLRRGTAKDAKLPRTSEKRLHVYNDHSVLPLLFIHACSITSHK